MVTQTFQLKQGKGRPTKMTAALSDAICRDAQVGLSMRTIANCNGIALSTLQRWLDFDNCPRPKQDYRDFQVRFARARGEAEKWGVQMLRGMATGAVADGDLRAVESWLSRCTEYVEVRGQEVSGPEGGAIEFDVVVEPDLFSKELDDGAYTGLSVAEDAVVTPESPTE